MISDTLHDAVVELDNYLDSDDWRGTYGLDGDPLMVELRALRDAMNTMRERLDRPPAAADVLAQALAFYADPDAWLLYPGRVRPAITDSGLIARRALAVVGRS